MAFKTKAETSFEEKVQKAVEKGDWDRVTLLGTWYDGYINLVAAEEDEKITPNTYAELSPQALDEENSHARHEAL